MKYFLGLLVASLALNGVLALPAPAKIDDAEVIDVPRRRVPYNPIADDDDDDSDTGFRDFKGIIDTGVGYPFLQPNPHSFSFNLGFFDSFEDIFRRLHTRLWPVEVPVGGGGGAAGSGSDSSVEGGLFNLNGKNGNTTSTVKVVDGHKIEVNETVYGDDNNLFKVRIVQIRPVEEGEGAEESDSGKPVTAAPTGNNNDNDDEESDERREPLEKKQSNENEIRGEIDGPEHSTTPKQEEEEENNTMLPTANEDNTANLNAAFVTDNSLEENGEQEERGNGNIEAETNKPDNQNEMMMAGNDETVLVAEEPNAAGSSSSSLVDSERLTIENNEEAEVNDNFNESPAAIELTKELSELVLSEAATETEDAEQAEDDEEDEELRAELDEDDNIDDALAVAAAEFDTESVEDDNNDDVAAMHSNYRQREDATSSDDDDDESNAGNIEMNPEFDSEWANLAEDLANVNDHNNDLNNEIDQYDTVPVDLSNDIAVNDAAALDPNFAHNPEAEFVDIDGVITSSTMPKFEKLSVAAENMK